VQRLVVTVELVVLVFAQCAHRHRHGLVDRVDDVFVVGVSEVIEDLARFVRTDTGGLLDRRQEQRLLGCPRRDEGDDVRPGGVHSPIAGRNDRLAVDIGVCAVQRFRICASNPRTKRMQKTAVSLQSSSPLP
jgi:hypothetical protein